jgi:hypothetical protein
MEMTTVHKPEADASGATPPKAKQSTADLSGAHWVNRFRGSTETRDLRMPFRSRAEAFIGALRSSGATVTISATFRDPRRAYLMHWAWRIAKANLDPQAVPPLEGVSIIWAHEGSDGKFSLGASLAAAHEMVRRFEMQRLGTAPALRSRHTLGYAVDMSIRWNGVLSIPDAYGNTIEITSTPRTGVNWQLRRVGESYGVIKYCRAGRDDPHWSDIGA